MNFAEGRDGLHFIGQDLRRQTVHAGQEGVAQHQGQGGDGRSTQGQGGSTRQCITDGGAHGGHQGDAVIGGVERADEARIHRVVVLEHQQGHRAQQKVSRHREQGHGEKQGHGVGLQDHGEAMGGSAEVRFRSAWSSSCDGFDASTLWCEIGRAHV